MSPKMPAELRVLRDLFQQCDPPPGHVLAAAYAAAEQARAFPEAGCLELVGDSAEAPAPTRSGSGGPDARVLTFLMPGRIVELDLVPMYGGMFRASGMVINRAGQGLPRGDVLLRHPNGHRAAELDRHGAFGVADVPSGPLSVVFRPVGAAPAVADWLVC